MRRRGLFDGLPSRILILTTYDADEYLHDAIRAGAAGFLLKDTRRDDLTHAIRTVAAGDALLHPALTRRLHEPHPCRRHGLRTRARRTRPDRRHVRRGRRAGPLTDEGRV